MENNFYTYILCDPRKKKPFFVGKGTNIILPSEPFYVGKGIGNRVNTHLDYPNCDKHNRFLFGKLKKIEKLGLIPSVYIIPKLIEKDALENEKYLVKVIGRLIYKNGPLCNIKDGGEPNFRDNSKPVYQIDPNTLQIIKEFKSGAAAQRELDTRELADVCLKTAKLNRYYLQNGFYWMYVEDYKKSNIQGTAKKLNDLSLTIKVVQFDLQGNRIKIWDSLIELKRELHISLPKNIKHKVGNFMFRRYSEVGDIEKIEPYCRLNNKKILQYDLFKDIIIQIWNSATIAGNSLNIKRGAISRCCRKLNKSAGGYRWLFENDNNKLPIIGSNSISAKNKLREYNEK